MSNKEDSKNILNEDEINMLSEQYKKTGVDLLVDSSFVSYERLPMLEVVMDRLIASMSNSLRSFTTDVADTTLDHTNSIRFGDFIKNIDDSTMLSIFKTDPWGKHGLICINKDLSYMLIDILLGGRKSESFSDVESKNYTSIEQNLIERFVKIILNDFSEAFSPICSVDFLLKRTETNPKFATIVTPNDTCILNRIKIEIGEKSGNLDILIPLSTLEPVRENLLQTFMGEKFGQDQMWKNHLAKEVLQTNVKTEAILDQIKVSLSDVVGWKKGSQISLDADEESRVLLKCGDRVIMTGKIGNVKGRVAVQIEENLLKSKDDL